MSNPDFQDWQRSTQRVAVDTIFNQVVVPLPMATVMMGRPILGFEQIGVVITTDAAAGQAWTVHLSWFTDESTTIELGRQTFYSRGSTPISDVVPVVGPFLTVNVDIDTLVAGEALVTVWQAPTRDPWTKVLGDGVLGTLRNLGLGAGAVRTVDLDIVTTGLATLVSRSGNATVSASVWSYDPDGISRPVAALGDGTGFQGTVQFHLPGRACFLQHTNTGGVAHDLMSRVTLGR